MNKNVIILGSVALLGVGVILYFKLKKTDTEDSLLSEKSKGKDNSKPLDLEAVANKVADARKIAEKICELKKTYNIVIDEMEEFVNFSIKKLTRGIKKIGFRDISLKNAIRLTPLGAAFSIVRDKGESNNSLLERKRKEAIETISKLILELKELGYIEVDCKLVKIAEV